MKIDRRCFLSLGIGATAGTVLSPLPWKLTDDLSIWTQMWPWTPRPPKGESHYVHSVSTLCRGNCGISVRKVDDRAVKIEGMSGYPGCDGNACNLCLSGLQLLYGPTAIRTPLKRVGERGEGKWRKISWSRAIGEVSGKLKELRASGKSAGVACISATEFGTVAELFKRFLTAYGSPNFITDADSQDTYEMAMKLMHGQAARPGYDFENADFIVSFGAGILDGWGASVRMFKAKTHWKETGAKVVQVDPRLSVTAAKSDAWLPVNPGTEAMLALAMAHVIVSESLYNKDFVEKYSEGFEDWAGSDGELRKGFKTVVMEHFNPSRVSGVIGIDSGTIEELAKQFAKAKHPMAICGRGKGLTPGSLHETMAVHALNALVGNLNQPGGIWAIQPPDYVEWDAPDLDDVAEKGLATPRIDGAGTEAYPLAKSLVNRIPTVVNAAGGDSPIQLLMVAGANPCYTLRDSEAVAKAFSKIPFIVSFAAHMNETAEMADIILPDLGHLERFEDVPAPMGINRPMIGLARPVVPPQGDAKHAGDSVILLAKALGGTVAKAFGWKNYQACLEGTFGDKWEAIREAGFIYNANYVPDPWKYAFQTESKKFLFMSEACGHDPEKGGIGRVPAQGDANAFPLLLIPYDSMRLASGAIGDTPFVMKTVEDTTLEGEYSFVEVNPKTGGEAGLAEGVIADLSTPNGTVKVKVHFFDGIKPGLVAIPTGLGRSGADEYMAGKGVNVNKLIGPVEDPVSGMDAAWGIRAKLSLA